MQVRGVFSLALLLVSCIAVGAAQRPRPGVATTPTDFDCTFAASATVAWEVSTPRIGAQQGSPLELRIGNVDLGRGTAEFMHGAVSTAATVIVNGSVVHLIQPPDDGSFVMASIDLAEPDIPGFRASYSRTRYYSYSGPGFVSTPQAGQQYGYCVPAK
jgi:hypothetical protein